MGPWSKPQATLPEEVDYVELCICKQKNNDNYQKITYSRCHKNPLLCPVYAAFRIYCRGLRLEAPTTHPAAIYWDKQSKVYKLITSTQTNSFLRQTASSTFGIPPKCKTLDKWSCHSIRVTATNLLRDTLTRISKIDSAGGAMPSSCTYLTRFTQQRTTLAP